ncbi:TPA: hypothetical protein U8175_001236 [Pseudomonas aeruginosa]|nr:hypothetical protein [Pseudomonas aeruginosa]MDI3829435.1 hypothetical protein [Pseudomonas aeruginosa]HBN9565027.1 hypothetical protein [Pseudomonas aeruginosa]HBO3132157.1 hypothetical protein [Pseudomonas aeruginosa]HEH9254310.1 hypothetical protein [Pseudomonas aeruginosa]
MLTVRYPHLMQHVVDLHQGICTIANDADGTFFLIIKAPKENILAAKMRQRIGFYLAPCLLDGITYHSLVTTYEDDEFNPLFINTPLLDDEMGRSILHILSVESFNVHFFDDNNREILGYKAQNPKYSSFDKESYKLAPSSLEAAYRIRDISHDWFVRRTLKDDSEAIRVTFTESLMVDDLFILDAIPMNNVYRKGPQVSHSTLEREEPGSYQEMDIVRLLQKVFGGASIFLNPLRTDNNEEFVDILVAAEEYLLLIQAKDSPNTEKSLSRTIERKRATVSKALDKAIDQTRGAIKYLRRQEDLHFHFGDEIFEIETHGKDIRNLIVVQETFEYDWESYTSRALKLSDEMGSPCYVMGYPELVTWTAKLNTPEKFFEPFDSIIEEGRQTGVFPRIIFYK